MPGAHETPSRSRGWALGTRWLGVGLATCIAALTIWLWATGRIGLYINPDAAWWAVSMSFVVLVGAVWSCTVRIETGEHEHPADPHEVPANVREQDSAPELRDPAPDGAREAEAPRSRAEARAIAERAARAAEEQAARAAEEQASRAAEEQTTRAATEQAHHDHDLADPVPATPRRGPLALGATLVGGALASAFVVSTLVLPPAVLSTELALSRAAGAPPQLASSSTIQLASSADTSQFGVGDWAALIATTTNPASFIGAPVTLTGFVGHDRDGGFDITRLVIVHCVIDAQAASVPVQQLTPPAALTQGEWVTITGTMATDASGSLVVDAQTIAPITTPTDPYEN